MLKVVNGDPAIFSVQLVPRRSSQSLLVRTAAKIILYPLFSSLLEDFWHKVKRKSEPNSQCQGKVPADKEQYDNNSLRVSTYVLQCLMDLAPSKSSGKKDILKELCIKNFDRGRGVTFTRGIVQRTSQKA